VYNLGNAIYKQKQSSEAKFRLSVDKSSKSRVEKHRAFHNLGKCLMNEKDYSQAVEAYKKCIEK
jgi:Tfp pilus assembly protein PilF